MSVTDPPDVRKLVERVAGLEKQLAAHQTRLHGMQDISSAIGSTLNLDRLLDLIMNKITQLMEADRSTLWLIDQETRELWSKVALGSGEIRIPMSEGLAGWVASTGQSINLKDAYKDSRFNQDVDRGTGYRTTSMLCMPMRNHRSEITGVVQVLNKSDGYFGLEDEALLSTLASQAAISIENSKLYVSVIGKNIELTYAHEQLKQRISEIDLLFKIEQEMNRQIGLEGFLGSLLQRARSAIPSDAGALLVRGELQWTLYVNADGAVEPLVLTHVTPEQGGAAMSVALSGEELMDNQIEDENYDPALREALGFNIEAALAVPLEIGGERFGSLLLLNKRGIPTGEYTDTDRKMLTVIAGRAESAIVLNRQRDEEMNANRLAAIGQALSGVLHDLKTPMTVIGGYSQLMVDEEAESERKAMSQTIGRQLKHLKTMTHEILAFARGESSLLIRKVFLHTYMTELQEGLRQEFGGRMDLGVELGYRDGIRMDVGKIQRVIFNLARNARQAMEGQPGPKRFLITTALDDENDIVEFRFRDTGPGIPEEIRNSLFESFVTSGKKDGTGLGLAIVKKIVEQHKGTIDYTTAPGEGTTFIVRLPKNLA